MTGGPTLSLPSRGHVEHDLGCLGPPWIIGNAAGDHVHRGHDLDQFGLDLEQTLMRYVHLYNTQLPQSALGSKTPMQAMKNWHKSHPHLFVKSPRSHTGRDN